MSYDAIALIDDVPVYSANETGVIEEVDDSRYIVSDNGLELVEWYTTNGHELHIIVWDVGYSRESRKGKVNFTMTPAHGKSVSDAVSFSCSPHDAYNRRIFLMRYQPDVSGQWAYVELTVNDNKGVSEFWFDVWLN